MPNRWNASIVVRLTLGLVVGVASCAALFPFIRSVGIALVSPLASALDPATRMPEVVTRVWSANSYMIWLAWVCAAVAIAIDWVPDRNKWKAVLVNGAGEAAILLAAILLLVQAHTSGSETLLRNLAGLLVFTTIVFPVLAVRRTVGAPPVRVFDAE